MGDPKKQRQKALVGNDILPRAQRPKPVKKEKPRPLIKDIRLPLPKKIQKSTPAKAPQPEIKQEQLKQAVVPTHTTPHNYQPFINALAYDLFIIVLFGYVSTISHWLYSALLLYAAAVLLLHIASRRMYISALVCLILVPVVKLADRASLEKAYALLTVYFLVLGSLEFLLQYLKARQKKT